VYFNTLSEFNVVSMMAADQSAPALIMVVAGGSGGFFLHAWRNRR
jgi:hypothetical protein